MAFSLLRRERKADMGGTLGPAWWALGLLISTVAGAAEPETELGPVTVPLPESAPESPSQREPTGAVTVLDVEGFAHPGMPLGELLEHVPGLRVHESGGMGQAQSVSLRGASASGVKVLFDGMPMGLAGSAVDLSLLPLSLVEKVEVLRGAAGASYGAGAMGGVIHLSSVRPRPEPRLFTRVGAGSFGVRQVELGGTVAVGPGGAEALLLVHGARSQGGFPFLYDPQPSHPTNALELRSRDNNDARSEGALARYRVRVGDEGRADAWVEVHRHARGLAGTEHNPTKDAREDGDRQSGTVRFSHPLGGGELGVRAFGRRERLQFEGGYFSPGHQQTELGFGLEGSFRAVLFEQHAVSLSGELGQERLLFGGRTDPKRRMWAVSLADEWLVGDGGPSVVPAVRFEQVGAFGLVSPKLGARLELGRGFAWRGNFGQASRAPSFLELEVPQGALLPNPDLRPERALGGDAGVGHEGLAHALWLTGFATVYEDLIAYEYYPPLLSRPYNFGAARVSGLEVEGRWTPRPWVALETAYTLLHTRNTRDLPGAYGKALPYRPRHALFGRLALGPERLRGHAEVNAQSRQFQNRTEQLWLEARAFVDVGLSAQLPYLQQARLNAEFTNLFDVHSADLAGYPLPGRAVQLSFAWTFEPAPSLVSSNLKESSTP